jgi:boron transporter
MLSLVCLTVHLGLIPQAPIHTQSLVVLGQTEKKDTETGHVSGSVTPSGDAAQSTTDDAHIVRREVAVAVVEQRVSNLAQGAMCLVLLTGPFLHVLGLIPRGVCIDPFSDVYLTPVIYTSISFSGVLGGLL